MDRKGINEEKESLTFREWYVLMNGRRYLDCLPEEEAEKRISEILSSASKTSGAGLGGKSTWIKECTPGCLCHEDCIDRDGGCVYGSPRRDTTSRKPPGIFRKKPRGGGYQRTGWRTLPAGAEGYGNCGGLQCINHVIDKVMNGYCYWLIWRIILRILSTGFSFCDQWSFRVCDYCNNHTLIKESLSHSELSELLFLARSLDPYHSG